MAEQGTFIGEVQRAGRRFWGTRWFIKWPIIAFLGLVLLGIVIPSGDEKDASTKAAVVTAEATQATSAPATSAPKATDVPSTNTPKPTDTPRPAPTPTPELTLEQKFSKSYKDNRGFMVRAVGDPDVTWNSETGTLEFRKEETVLSEGDALTVTAHSTLVAVRAIMSTYPEVNFVQFTLMGKFTNLNTGVSTTEISAAIMFDRSTALALDLNGMKNNVIADNKRLFCAAPSHFINITIYKEIKDKGCIGLPGKNPDPMVF